MPETIGIVAWGAMADALYATPIVSQIRRMSPESHITWLIRDKFVEVVKTNPDIDDVRAFTLPEGHDNRQDAEYVMDQEILKFAHDTFDKVYDLQYWPRYSNFFERANEDFISLRARNAGLVAPTKRKIRIGYTLEDESAVVDFLYDNKIDKVDIKFITVNHISYAASPVWSPDNYSKLVDILKNEHDVSCVFTGAPNEPIPEGCIDARGMPYRVWSYLINASDLWLGLDSGAVALACAGSVPIIKLHSPDFPLAKTGIKAMGLRHNNVLELNPAPSPEAMAELITENMRESSGWFSETIQGD